MYTCLVPVFAQLALFLCDRFAYPFRAGLAYELLQSFGAIRFLWGGSLGGVLYSYREGASLGIISTPYAEMLERMTGAL